MINIDFKNIEIMPLGVSNGSSSGGGSSGDSNDDKLFYRIGYDKGIPQYILDGEEYAKKIYDEWDGTKEINAHGYFIGDKQLIFLPLIDTSKVSSMGSMFSGCTKLQYVPSLNTANCSLFSFMFYNCSSLITLDLSNWNTSKAVNTQNIFNGCTNLTSLDLSSFDTSKVYSMNGMFSNCGSLTSITFGDNFDTSNATDMSNMFYNCSGLTSIDLSSWNTSNVTNMSNMFSSCNSLYRVDGYISFMSFSNSTMSYSYLLGYNRQRTLRKITFKDIGYNSNAVQFNMSYDDVWGVNSNNVLDARQSLIDSLITYSFDRASAGYATCTVTLTSNTKAVLTEDEIAAITAKGFTIA